MAIPWAAIGGAAQAVGALGGMFGLGQKDKTNTGLNNWSQQLSNQIAYDSFYRGMEMRVADAKRAGLHPLSAIGTPINPVTPIIQGERYQGSDWTKDLQNMGQSLQQLQAPTMTPEQREMHDANLQAIRARAANDAAEASYWASQASKARSEQSAAGSPPVVSGLVAGQPDAVTSSKVGSPHVTAGTHSAFKDVVVIDAKGKPRTIAVPNPDVLQDQEGVGYTLFAHENFRRWIESLKRDFRDAPSTLGSFFSRKWRHAGRDLDYLTQFGKFVERQKDRHRVLSPRYKAPPLAQRYRR